MSYIIHTIIALGGFSLKAFLIKILIHMLIGFGIYIILVVFSCYVMRNTIKKRWGIDSWAIADTDIMWINLFPILGIFTFCCMSFTLPSFKWYRSSKYYYKKYDVLIKMMQTPSEADLGNAIFKEQIKDRAIQELISKKIYHHDRINTT